MRKLDPTAFHPDVAPGEPIIRVRDLAVGFGDRLVNNHLNLDVMKGEILGVVGASGTGKSVLLRTIVGLIQKKHGTIELFGADVDTLTIAQRRLIERRWGILYQQGALFSSLTVKQNIQFPMREYLDFSEELLEEMAMVKLKLVGLKPEAAERLPSELSGGMIKRAALARALALDPEIVFLDEPTSGLDPIGAQEFDDLIATLQKTLGLTVFMVTHDLDSLAGICDRIAALGEGKVLHEGTLADMKQQDHPWLQAYFNGARARASHVHDGDAAPLAAAGASLGVLGTAMENRANFALVGLFTLAVLGAAFGFVYWFKRGGESTNRQPYDIYFTGSVSGLVKGAAVRFNGLRVGEVVAMDVVKNDPGRVWARVEVSADTPVRADTIAQLEYQGLTGVASVALTGGAASSPPLQPDKSGIPQINARRSDYQDILETVQRLSIKIDTVLTRVDGALSDSQAPFVQSMKNIESVTAELKAAQLGKTMEGIQRFSDMLGRNAQKFDNIVSGVERVFGTGDDGQMKGLMADLGETAKSIRILANNIDKRTAALTVGLNRFTGPGLRELEALTAESRKAVNDVSRAVRTLEDNPQRLLFGGKPAIPEYSR